MIGELKVLRFKRQVELWPDNFDSSNMTFSIPRHLDAGDVLLVINESMHRWRVLTRHGTGWVYKSNLDQPTF